MEWAMVFVIDNVKVPLHSMVFFLPVNHCSDADCGTFLGIFYYFHFSKAVPLWKQFLLPSVIPELPGALSQWWLDKFSKIGRKLSASTTLPPKCPNRKKYTSNIFHDKKGSKKATSAGQTRSWEKTLWVRMFFTAEKQVPQPRLWASFS